jgi:4-amino-4-deoxy-L-arabinose transferase-like glycosyltransferase
MAKKILPVLLFGLLLRLFVVFSVSAPFTYDQGRDLLILREMVYLKKPTLIGPTTSLHGVFCGPGWYYLILPFYVLSGGHPLSSLGPLFLLALLLPLVFTKLSQEPKIVLPAALVFTFTSCFFVNSTFALNSNPMIYLVPPILLLTTLFLIKGKNHFLFWALFLLGLGFHFNVVAASFLLPAFLVIFLLFKKKRKSFLGAAWAILGFFLPFLPQVIFDFRHDFLQTKTILALLKGQSGSLSLSQSSLMNRFIRLLPTWEEIFYRASAKSHPLMVLFLAIILWTTVLIWRRRRQVQKESLSQLFLVSLVFLLTSLLFLSLAPFSIWPWYLGPIEAIVVTLFLTSFLLLVKFKLWSPKLLFGLLFLWLVLEAKSYLPTVFPKELSQDSANLEVRLKIVDSLYQDAQGEGMKVYVFAPNVYDYPYQYLIWWHGAKKWGYLPEEFFYLPNQPAYVPGKEEIERLLPAPSASYTYLVSEPYDEDHPAQKEWFQTWRGRFPQADKSWEVRHTKIEKLIL